MLKMNKKGYSLVELIVAIPLLAIVFTTLGLTIAHQVRTYQELRLTSELNQELYNVIEIMRHGYPIDRVTDDEGLIGISTAQKVVIGFDRKSIRVEPRIVTYGLTYYASFFLDQEGVLRTSGQYATKTYTNKAIFPDPEFSSNHKIGRKNQFKITSFTISNATPNLLEPNLVKIEIEARVRFREKEDDQSTTEDIEKNTKTISYETTIFLANS